MKFQIRGVDFSEVEIVRLLLASNGWAHRVQDAERFAMLVDNSDLALVAVQGKQVVGFVRAITDRLSNGYISMLVVHPEYRRQGVGRSLVEAVIRHGPTEVTWMLKAERDGAAEFFAALGFGKSSEAMELKRQSP
jgi:ribosomal protein S18 acetylase RimI-like enzyme